MEIKTFLSVYILLYRETSQVRPLRKLVLPEYRPAFKVPAELFFAKEQRNSHKTSYTSKPTVFIGPSAGQFREVSLYC
jgi:hypothetical protein